MDESNVIDMDEAGGRVAERIRKFEKDSCDKHTKWVEDNWDTLVEIADREGYVVVW